MSDNLTLDISVIIPAFNVENFISSTVNSVLQFKEVAEIIIVEDGSVDNTLQKCRELLGISKKIKILQHNPPVNRGISASRNLGIKNSKFDYIAFLDADDIYLANRFDAEKKLLMTNKNIDGVYGALGTEYVSSDVKNKYYNKFGYSVITVNKPVPPTELKYCLLNMSRIYNGFFTLNTLTIKKKIIEDLNYFDESLKVHEDSDLLKKLAFKSILVAGIIDKPVAMRRIHDHNTITSGAINFHSRFQEFISLNKWVQANIQNEQKIKSFISKEILIYQLLKRNISLNIKIFLLIKKLKKHPFLFFLRKDFEVLLKGMFNDILFIRIINKIFFFLNPILFRRKCRYWENYFYN